MKKFVPIDENRLCRNCKHKGCRKVGYISWIYYCKIHKGNFNRGTGLGIDVCNKKPHPKCPLKTGELSDTARGCIKKGIAL